MIGAVTLGDGCRVGANAVVVRNVPAGATVVGIPARVVRRRVSKVPAAECRDELSVSPSVGNGAASAS